MTYKQAYDKVIEAYFKDDIEPLNPAFCFCGTLENNTYQWCDSSPIQEGSYSPQEFGAMESALLTPLMLIGVKRTGNDVGEWACDVRIKNHPQYEELLFKGMCASLDVLREIHKQRGEDVDSVPALTKRVLV